MIKLPPGIAETGILRIDWSGFSRILDCHRKAWHLLAWRRERDTEDPARGFGRAIHAGLDQRQKFGSGPYSNEQLAAVEAAAEKEMSGVELPEDEYRTIGRAKEVLGFYNQEMPSENFRILASELAAEKHLGMVAYNETRSDGAERVHYVDVRWTGRTDGIWSDGGKSWIKDTKTTKETTVEREMQKYRMSGQMRMYCWLFGGREFGPINDAVIDLIIVRKPVQKMTAKTRPRNEFHRMPFHYSDEEIERAKQMVLGGLSDWLTNCADHRRAPRENPESCVKYGCACPYFGVCENARETDRMNWLMGGEYRNYDFDPLKATTTTELS